MTNILQILLQFKNKELLVTAIGQILTVVFSFIFIKLVSHYAPVSEYGLYSLALSIAAFVTLYPFSAFDQAIARYISIFQSQNNYSKNYTNILFLYIFMIAFILLFFLLVYWIDIVSLSVDIDKILLSLVFFCVLNIFKTTLIQIENFNRNRLIVMYSKIFEGITRIVMLYGIINYAAISANNILWINVIVFICNIAFLLKYNREYLTREGIKITLLLENFRQFFYFSSPLLFWAVFSWGQLYIPIWFLNHYYSINEVGHFTMLNTLGTIVPAQIVGILSNYITPIMYQKESKEAGYIEQTTKKLFLFLVIIFICGGIIIYNSFDFFTILLSSPQYLQHANILPLLYLAACLSNIAVIWTYKFFAYKETKKLLFPQIMPAIVGLIVGYWLIPNYGVMGATYTTLSIAITYFLLLAIWYSSYYPSPYKES